MECYGQADALGDHFVACPRTGLLPRRGFVLERAWVQVAREAVGAEGRVVPQQWLARTTAPLVVYGATQGGEALCCDATLVSPLTRAGRPVPGADVRDGAALAAARRRKHARYPELLRGGPQRLVVLAAEVGGRWGEECQRFVRQLLRLRVQRAPATLRATAAQGWARRWWGLLSVAVQRAVASTALGVWTMRKGKGKEGKEGERRGRNGKQREGKGRKGKGREEKGREGKGRQSKWKRRKKLKERIKGRKSKEKRKIKKHSRKRERKDKEQPQVQGKEKKTKNDQNNEQNKQIDNRETEKQREREACQGYVGQRSDAALLRRQQKRSTTCCQARRGYRSLKSQCKDSTLRVHGGRNPLPPIYPKPTSLRRLQCRITLSYNTITIAVTIH